MTDIRGEAATLFFLRVSAPPREQKEVWFAQRRGDAEKAEKKALQAAVAAGVPA